MTLLALLGLLAVTGSSAAEYASWQGAVIRAAATECTACKATTFVLKSKLWDMIDTDELCEKLPGHLAMICQQGSHMAIDYIRTGITATIPEDCEALCSSTQFFSTDHACTLIENAHNGVTPMFADITSSLVPRLCQTDPSPMQCGQKMGGIVNILKTPLNNIFRRVRKGLECNGFENEDVELPDDTHMDWSRKGLRCGFCEAVLRIPYTQRDIFETVRSEAVEILESACEYAKEHDSTAMKNAPDCKSVVHDMMVILMSEQSNDYLCQHAFDCNPAKEEKTKNTEL